MTTWTYTESSARSPEISRFSLVFLAFFARFPRDLRAGWWALAWSLLWNIQVWVIGDGIRDEPRLEMIHIPVGIFLVVSGMFLAYRCLNVLRSSGSVEPV